jgi:dolichol-phosphate mannosyltransferase
MDPDFSIIAPMFNEEGAAAELVREIAAAFAGTAFEIVIVDDASRDGTRAALLALKAELPMLTVISHARNAGQSRALRSGVLAARGAIVVTLDGDGQNDPADAPRLAQRLAAAPASLGMIGGERVRRQDRLAKRWASRLANAVRGWLLGDHAADSGCGLKAIRRAVFLRLPFFDHQHRFLPALVLREGYEVAYEPVGHRPRRTGMSKYTNLGRLWSSVWDILGMLWLRARNRDPGAVDRF